MMKFEYNMDHKTQDAIFRLTIPQDCVNLVEFDEFSHALFISCEASDSIADKLLALETIVRKVEDAYKEGHKQHEPQKTHRWHKV